MECQKGIAGERAYGAASSKRCCKADKELHVSEVIQSQMAVTRFSHSQNLSDGEFRCNCAVILPELRGKDLVK